MKGRIKSYFITGLIALLPVILTIFILVLVYRFIFNIVSFVPFLDLPYNLGVLVNLLIIIAIIFLLGYITENIFMKRFYKSIEEFVITIPVLGKVYDSFRKITDALFIGNKKAFRRVVLVEYPRKGIFSIGFVTKEKEIINKQIYVNVYIPMVPLPMSGFLVHVREDQIIDTELSVEDAIKMIASGGVIGGAGQ